MNRSIHHLGWMAAAAAVLLAGCASGVKLDEPTVEDRKPVEVTPPEAAVAPAARPAAPANRR